MATEKELKLAISTVSEASDSADVASKASAEAAQLASITTFFATHSAQPGHTFLLGNVYFDTPDLDLARDKVALRLRRTPYGWLQTLKTAGQAKDGLHARGEWELPVDGEALDLPALLAMCDDTEAVRSLTEHAPRLASVFRTDFERTTWDLTIDDSHIEAALDVGKVHLGEDIAASAQNQDSMASDLVEVPIREIELELKTGDESALWQLARILQAAVPGLKPDDVSKAARGYRLVRAAAGNVSNAAANAHAAKTAHDATGATNANDANTAHDTSNGNGNGNGSILPESGKDSAV